MITEEEFGITNLDVQNIFLKKPLQPIVSGEGSTEWKRIMATAE